MKKQVLLFSFISLSINAVTIEQLALPTTELEAVTIQTTLQPDATCTFIAYNGEQTISFGDHESQLSVTYETNLPDELCVVEMSPKKLALGGKKQSNTQINDNGFFDVIGTLPTAVALLKLRGEHGTFIINNPPALLQLRISGNNNTVKLCGAHIPYTIQGNANTVEFTV